MEIKSSLRWNLTLVEGFQKGKKRGLLTLTHGNTSAPRLRFSFVENFWKGEERGRLLIVNIRQVWEPNPSLTQEHFNFAQNFWKGNNRGRYLLCSEPGPNSCHPPVFDQRGVLSKQHVRQSTLHLELLWIQSRYIAKDRKPKLHTNETIHRLHFQATDSKVRFVKVTFMPRLTMKQPKSQEQTWCPLLHQNEPSPRASVIPFYLLEKGSYLSCRISTCWSIHRPVKHWRSTGHCSNTSVFS